MYKNVGKVLCVVARIVGIMGMIASFVGLIWLISAQWDSARIIALMILGGGIVLFISSFPFYGFGQLIVNVQYIRDYYEVRSYKEKTKEEKNTSL